MKLNHFSSQKNFISDTVQFIEEICKTKKGIIHIALSGGSTPEPIYKKLRTSKKIPWSRIHFFLVDERYVPLKNADSNYKMITKAFGQPVLKKLKNFTYFHTDLPIKKCLDLYEKELKKISFDLTILGVGPDGHTASLFPRSAALTTKKPVAHTTTKQFSVKDRLTLTFPPILKSKKILILLKGKEKYPVLHELQKNGKKNSSAFPAKILVKHRGLTIHFLQSP